ncbi:hypothetical protein CTEN210_01336 [Chaetoceros tenuissimus]|uniref:Ricin B lectin domain-containing protein n=1 Tax=Chaetoceros tenuissimus TaxID=426638 RepID=A0AAD3CEY4_9STRA|nr:hypothetical protein CTEN210_01336 [Chaetoceros tenuissimus]
MRLSKAVALLVIVGCAANESDGVKTILVQHEMDNIATFPIISQSERIPRKLSGTPFPIRSMQTSNKGVDLCLEVSDFQKDVAITVNECEANNDKQMWTTDGSSRIILEAAPSLCLTRVVEKGTKKKSITLKPCSFPSTKNMWIINAFDNTIAWKKKGFQVLGVKNDKARTTNNIVIEKLKSTKVMQRWETNASMPQMFSIQNSVSSSDGKKLCVEVTSSNGRVVLELQECRDTSSQIWESDGSVIRSAADKSNCIIWKKGTKLGAGPCTKAQKFVSFAYNTLDKTIVLKQRGIKAISLKNDSNKVGAELELKTRAVQLDTQTWLLDTSARSTHTTLSPSPSISPSISLQPSLLIKIDKDCTSSEPCKLCQGDCDDDDECEADLVCAHRDGFESIPGCSGEGGNSDLFGKDVCVEPPSPFPSTTPTVSSQPSVTNQPSFSNMIIIDGDCSSSEPCAECFGDCDHDDQCEGDLVCGQRDGFEPISGCVGEGGKSDVKGKDVCMQPPKIKYVGECRSQHQCGLCQGDCDDDDDCEGSLVCVQRDNYEPVLGCNGDGLNDDKRAKDICAEAVPFPSSTPSVSSAPSFSNMIIIDGDCSSSEPCAECFGDCDHDDQCEGDLVCGQRDGFEPISGCVGEGGKSDVKGKDVCMQPPKIKYVGECRSQHQCGLCQGDCDDDDDCEGSLVCVQRDNYEPVLGCNGDGLNDDKRAKDICAEAVPFPSSTPSVSSAPSFSNMIIIDGDCSSSEPCAECFGDCDHDDQCEGDLVCGQRDGFEPISGCVGEGGKSDVKGKDVCMQPPKIKYVGECTSQHQCRLCQGDCDDDDDCEGNLVCVQRDNYEPVLGCNGDGLNDDKRAKDICAEAVPFPSSTPSVSSAPSFSNMIIIDGDCSSSEPCAECFGDCDHDDQCEGDLVCGQRDGFEPISGCVGEGGKSDVKGKDVCMQPPKIKYVGECTSQHQCRLCQGDCDDDDDCEGNLVCVQRDNYEPVLGCNGDGLNDDKRAKDICAEAVPFPSSTPSVSSAPSLTESVITFNGDCSSSEPCAECFGDCDNDRECEGNLVCAQRNSFEEVPGCRGEGGTTDIEGKDVCIQPPKIKYIGECKSSWKCGLCQGDCDDDDDCADGLVCRQRNAFESVPGCFGEGLAEDREGKDICNESCVR